MFVVGTETDHIAPWRSVYKVHLFTDNELTFLLTNGGHNAGIVSEPGHHGRHYVMAHAQARRPLHRLRRLADPRHTGEGSWWPAWASWLESKSDVERVAPPGIGAPSRGLIPLCPAPGVYVYER